MELRSYIQVEDRQEEKTKECTKKIDVMDMFQILMMRIVRNERE